MPIFTKDFHISSGDLIALVVAGFSVYVGGVLNTAAIEQLQKEDEEIREEFRVADKKMETNIDEHFDLVRKDIDKLSDTVETTRSESAIERRIADSKLNQILLRLPKVEN